MRTREIGLLSKGEMSLSGGGVLFVVYSLMVVCSAQVIIEPPKNTTVFLHHDAVFTCVSADGVSDWIVNGTLASQFTHSITHTSSGSRVNYLTIPARDMYNRTTVQCVVFSYSSDKRLISEEVKLSIQGPPSSVGEVKISYENTSVTVNWTAPFSLDVTGVDHDIWYSVIIYNVTDENNPTVMDCTDCINITDTHYTFTPSPCTIYNISVMSGNGVGEGNMSSPVKASSVPNARSKDNNKIIISGVFTFDEVLVVMQCDTGTPDVFRIFLPVGDDTCIEETLSNIKASVYDIFIYDFPPNPKPDYTLENKSVEGEAVQVMNSSLFLENGVVEDLGSVLRVTCVFKDNVAEETSCILIYREYGSELVSTKQYNKNFEFPLDLAIENFMNYTFSIFGRNGTYIDESPIFTEMFTTQATPSSAPTKMSAAHPETKLPSPDGGRDITESLSIGAIAAIVIVIFVVMIVIVTAVVAVYIAHRKWKRKKSVRYDLKEENCLCFYNDIRPCGVSPTGGVSCDGETTAITTSLANDMKEEEESKYATLVTQVSGPKPPLSMETAVKYEEIDLRATQKLARSQYADLQLQPSNTPEILPHQTITEGPYVVIKQPQINPAPVIDPPTVESVMSKLYCEASQWKEIAEMMEFDEDLIDEIDVNNDHDVMCLQVCVEEWISKLHPSWERVESILSGLREKTAERAVQEITENNNRRTEFLTKPAEASVNEVGDLDVVAEHNKLPNVDVKEGEERGSKVIPTSGNCSKGSKPAAFNFIFKELSDDDKKDCNEMTYSIESEDDEIFSSTFTFNTPAIPSVYGGVCIVGPNTSYYPSLSDDVSPFKSTTALVGSQVANINYSDTVCGVQRGHTVKTSPDQKSQGRKIAEGGVIMLQPQCNFKYYSMSQNNNEEVDVETGPVKQVPYDVEDDLPKLKNVKHFGIGFNAPVYQLSVTLGVMVTGKKRQTTYDRPEETSQHPVEPPTVTQPFSPDTSEEEIAMNNHGPLFPVKILAELKKRILTESKRQLTNLPFLDPPANYREKIPKWMTSGTSQGFHDPPPLFVMGTHH